jgi:hypothetical protein
VWTKSGSTPGLPSVDQIQLHTGLPSVDEFQFHTGLPSVDEIKKERWKLFCFLPPFCS